MARVSKKWPDDPSEGEESQAPGENLPPIENLVRKLSERFSEELSDDD